MPKLKSKPDHRILRYKVRPYGSTVVIHVCKNVAEAFEESEIPGKPGPSCIALTWSSSHSVNVHMFFPQGASLGTTVHESFHAICVVLGKAGVVFSDESEEVWAYHLDELTQVAAEFIHLKEKPKKSLTEQVIRSTVEISATET
jgi:hypothetical protein